MITTSNQSSQHEKLSLSLKIISVLALISISVLARDILLLSFIALMVSVLISFPVNLLSKKLPRGLSVILTLIMILGGFGLLGAFTIPKITEQFQSVVQRLPEAVDHVQSWYSNIKKSEPVSQLTQGKQFDDRFSKRIGTVLETGVKGIFPAAKGAVESVTTLIFVFILAIFLVHQPRSYRNGFRNLFPKHKESLFNETYSRLAQGLRHWLGGILVSMTLMGIFTAAGLALAGIDNWFLLAVLTFLGTFVPYLGAIMSAIPGLLIGLSQSPQHFLYASFVYLGVHFIEGYIVQPIIMKRAVELRPALLLFGQALLGSLFGVLGIVVAAPLLACIQIAVQYLYIERQLGRKPESDLHSDQKSIAA